MVALVKNSLALLVCKIPSLAGFGHDAEYLHCLRGHRVTLTGFCLDLVDLVDPPERNASHFTTTI